ncbi:MAG: PKD domain-containing protein, partial [Planctomycetaceae bacterium]
MQTWEVAALLAPQTLTGATIITHGFQASNTGGDSLLPLGQAIRNRADQAGGDQQQAWLLDYDIAGEGRQVAFSALATDPGPEELLYEWDFSYGGDPAGFQAQADGSQVVHRFPDNGGYTVAVRVSDADGGVAIDTLKVTVLNVPPSVDLGGDRVVDEGTLIRLDAVLDELFTDPGTLDTHTFTWTVTADNGQVIPGSSASLLEFTPENQGAYTIQLQVQDKDGGSGADQIVVTVHNVSPHNLQIGGPATAQEGQQVEWTGSFQDPGILDPHTYRWEVVRSNGQQLASAEGHLPAGQRTVPPFAFTPVLPGVYTVKLTVADELDAATQMRTLQVGNVAPSGVTILAEHTELTRGTPLVLSGTFVDPGDDTWTAIADFGDGVVLPLNVDGRNFGIQYLYGASGSYDLTVTVRDSFGATASASETIVILSDGTPPSVQSLAVSGAGPNNIITDATVGAGALTVTVVFSDAMNPSATPTLVFHPDVTGEDGTLSFASGSWSAVNTTYTAVYDVADRDVEVSSVTIGVTGAEDPAGNPLQPYTPVHQFAIDTRKPTVAILSPPDNAVAVPVDTDLTLSFDEPIQVGAGTIGIRRTNDDSLVEAIAVPNADTERITVDGAQASIGLTDPLPVSTSFYVQVSAGTFRDLAGTDFAGILDPTDWTFATVLDDDAWVGVQVIAVASPSAPGANVLPVSLGTVSLGSTYFVEVWVQDRLLPGVGIAGGKVDMHYTAAVADAVTVVNQDFDASPGGVIDPASGHVQDLGGETPTGGRGIAPQWARLGYVEFVATDLGEASFELSPGSLAFSRFGVGNVPWDLVDLGAPIVVDQIVGTRIDMTIVHEPSATDVNGEVGELPASADWVHEWQSFWVEIWVSTPDMPTLAVAGATVDLQYHSDYLTALEIEYGSAFPLDRAGTIDDALGLVGGISGSTGSTGVVGDGYVLLARVRFASTGDDQVPVDEVGRNIGPYDMELVLANGLGRLAGADASLAALGESPDTELWAVVYDMDDNH